MTYGELKSAVKPAERKVSWRIPTRGPWQEVDLRKYFTNT